MFIDVGVFKDRVVAMGKPHCNHSNCTFGLWIMRFCYPVPELVEGSNLHLLTVAHASGSDLIILLLISVSPLLLFPCFSVSFRG